jgi:hypothetical protein
MAKAAKDPKFAAENGISQEVAQEFIDSDPGGPLPERRKMRRGKRRTITKHNRMLAKIGKARG